MKKTHSLLFGLLATLCISIDVLACSSAVISGKVTPDGRPLLWKNRDTGYMLNHMAYVKGEKYDFIANVNSEVYPRIKEAWMGMNSAGFALMNTQSYNLVEVKEGEERGEANGRVMFRALEVCATVEEFCHFLDTIQKPSLIEANFGVIDAQGGAAMFEVDYYNYIMYDANNPKDAPYGYVARTNFSFAGKVNEGAGYVRYMETNRVLMQASATGGITPQAIFNDLSRSFRNQMLGIDLKEGNFNRPQGSGWFIDQDFIPRNSTSCSIVVQGVKRGEPADLSAMWTVLGYPPTGVALPLFVKGGEQGLPALMRYDKRLNAAPLSAWSLQLAKHVFGYKQGMGTGKYLHWELLYNREGTGWMQQFVPLEEQITKRAKEMMKGWYARQEVNPTELNTFYQTSSTEIEELFNHLLPNGK